jgi:uncharacterized protein involved in outer membrane biogenesis
VLGAGLLVLLLGVGVGAVAYLALYLDRHRGLVEAGARRVLGRRVEVQDRIGVDWSMRPGVALEGVGIANPPWAGGAHLARPRHVSLQLALWALLRGRVEVGQVTVQHADLVLEVRIPSGGSP